MAYCPKCRQNVSIVVRTQYSNEQEEETTDKYYIDDNSLKVKYGEDVKHKTKQVAEEISCCSICFSTLFYPGAQSLQELHWRYKYTFEVQKKIEVDKYQSKIERKKPAYAGDIITGIVSLIFTILLFSVAKNTQSAILGFLCLAGAFLFFVTTLYVIGNCLAGHIKYKIALRKKMSQFSKAKYTGFISNSEMPCSDIDTLFSTNKKPELSYSDVLHAGEQLN